jgi:hypothetical protein
VMLVGLVEEGDQGRCVSNNDRERISHRCRTR